MADDGFRATVTGLPDLKAALARIAPELRRRALRNALGAGGRVVRDAARARAPVLKLSTEAGASAARRGVRRPGTLRQSIAVRTSKIARRSGNVGVFINVRPAKKGQRGARNPRDPFYWRFLEFGTRKLQGQGFLRAAAGQLNRALQVFFQKIGPQIQKFDRDGKATRL